MSEISAAQVKELRELTGISLMKCKKALEESGGDIESAREILRKQGEADAGKKADRETAEGLVALEVEGGRGVAAPVLCETDFVARDETFVALAAEFGKNALANAETAAAETEATLTAAIQKLGENIRFGEIKTLEGEIVGSYSHGGKIGVLVALAGGNEEVARDVAMQVAAMDPAVVTPEEVSDEAVAKEMEIQKELLLKEGKPEEMIEKIMGGKEKKFREDSALIKQSFVKDGSKTVEEFLAENGATVTGFVRVSV